MKNQVQLIAYVDRLSAGGIQDLARLLDGPLAGVFAGAHLLPFFDPIDGADAGFDPIDHTRVDPRLGSWKDLRALGNHLELMADLIVNHVSSQSPQFLDFSENGAKLALRWPVPHLRSRLPARRHGSRPAAHLSPASRTSLHLLNSAQWRKEVAVDHFHAAADRHRRHCIRRARPTCAPFWSDFTRPAFAPSASTPSVTPSRSREPIAS